MDHGYIEVSYVSTNDQCADSLTKYSRGGENQQVANAHMSLVKLENWLPRRGQVTRAKRVRFRIGWSFSNPGLNACSFRVRIFQNCGTHPFTQDKDYAYLMNRVRLGKQTKEDIELLKTRVRTKGAWISQAFQMLKIVWEDGLDF